MGVSGVDKAVELYLIVALWLFLFCFFVCWSVFWFLVSLLCVYCGVRGVCRSFCALTPTPVSQCFIEGGCIVHAVSSAQHVLAYAASLCFIHTRPKQRVR